MQKNLQRLARCISSDMAGLERRCPPSGVCHQISGGLSTLTTGAGDDQHAASVARIVKDADEREGPAGIEAAGGGDVFVTLTLSRVNIMDKFALGPGIEGKPKVKHGIEHRRPGVGPGTAEKDEVLICLKILHTEVCKRTRYPSGA